MLKAYTNGRFLDESQSLKIALIDIAEEGQDRPQPIPCGDTNERKASGHDVADQRGTGPSCNSSSDAAAKGSRPEIDATLELWIDDSRVDIELMPLPRRPTSISQYYPTLAYEIPGTHLKPGIYEIRATQSGKVVSATQVSVLPREIYRKLIKQVIAEEFSTEASPAFSISASWDKSWQRLLAYMGLTSLPHVELHLNLPSNRNREDAQYENKFYYDMGKQRFEWASFHLSRLILDRSVFGAEVHLNKNTVESGDLLLRIRSHFPQKALTQVPPQFGEFVNSVRYEGRNVGFSVDLKTFGEEDRGGMSFEILHG